jgi:hypothetical protein
VSGAGNCFEPVFGATRGLFTLVPGEGLHSILADGPASGFLVPSDGETSFPVSSHGSFFPQAYFRPLHRTPRPTTSPSPSAYFTRSANDLRKRRSLLVATGWFLFFGSSPL